MVYDSNEKNILYELKTFSSDIDTVIVVDRPENNIVANVEGIWIYNKFNVTFSVYDYKLNRWTDGTISRIPHFFSSEYPIKYDNDYFVMKKKIFSSWMKFYHKKYNTLLAEFQKRSRWLFWKPLKYDLKIYSKKLPDPIYFLALVITDHRRILESQND